MVDVPKVVEQIEYFDPNATDFEKWPGVLGLLVRKTTWMLNGEVWNTQFEKLRPEEGSSLFIGGQNQTRESPPASDRDRNVQPVQAPGTGYRTDYDALHPRDYLRTNSTIIPPRKPVMGIDSWPTLHIAGPNRNFQEDGAPTVYYPAVLMSITLVGAYGGDVRFPVMPMNEFGGEYTAELKLPRVINAGEMVLFGSQNLETIGWSSLFPFSYDPSFVSVTTDEFEDPESIVRRIIETIRHNMHPRLVVAGGIWNDEVAIQHFRYNHVPGEPYDYYYEIAFKRFREPTITSIPVPESARDRWYETGPVQGMEVSDEANARTGVEGASTGDGTNANATPIPLDPPEQYLIPPQEGRPMTQVIEITYVQHISPIAAGLDILTRTPGVQGNIIPFVGETVAQVANRLKPHSPNNNLDNILMLNSWMHPYDPHSDKLPVGREVRYYRVKPAPMDPSYQSTTREKPPIPVQVDAQGIPVRQVNP